VRVEHFDDAREVHERSAEAINLVDDHAVHFGGLDIHQELLQRGPIHVAAGIPTIVVVGRQQLPAITGEFSRRRAPRNRRTPLTRILRDGVHDSRGGASVLLC
jgi:hypothetical protein